MEPRLLWTARTKTRDSWRPSIRWATTSAHEFAKILVGKKFQISRRCGGATGGDRSTARYLRWASGLRPRHLQRSPTAKKSTVEPTHPRGAGGRNYQWLTPIDYVKNTLSFLKRSFLLHNWRKPCGAYIPTESRKAGSTEARGGRETEKDNENVSCKNNTGEWTPMEAHLAPLSPLWMY